ncbi:YolD-like family protein [Paenibacillus senegalensis]|uniref:YolD-like family protein n=1 Tax=Paenibacillus senegalensis TaxID=1465766 RepID=UPI000289F160|nr:YolD-like family protein [Paenibacillus senegalensis]
MKENKLTPGSNLMWESSRMILPEHREMILWQQRENKRLVKPILDEQQMLDIEQMLQHSQAEGVGLVLTLFGDFAYELVSGIVKRIERRGVELEQGEERRWIPFDRIIEASYA